MVHLASPSILKHCQNSSSWPETFARVFSFPPRPPEQTLLLPFVTNSVFPFPSLDNPLPDVQAACTQNRDFHVEPCPCQGLCFWGCPPRTNGLLATLPSPVGNRLQSDSLQLGLCVIKDVDLSSIASLRPDKKVLARWSMPHEACAHKVSKRVMNSLMLEKSA